MSLFKSDPCKKILKERDKLYKKSVSLQRNGDLRAYGEVMKRIEDLEREYDKIAKKDNIRQNQFETEPDAIDYDGMGNQGRFPTH